MKLKDITIRGFRGFNGARSIPMHERLTLISAPNSHGKTSISESFEWLLYGCTSKVAFADSKDEYRGSYRNIHLMEPEAPVVTVRVKQGAVETELQATLSGSEAVLRVNGSIVSAWPFAAQLDTVPKPFILQHALKDLLHAAPVDRFNRFATLLGFDELTKVHKDLMAFCTKPPLPPAAKTLVAEIESLVVRLEADAQLAPVARAIKKGLPHLKATRSLINQHARRLAPPNTSDTELLAALLSRKDAALSKVFKGSVAVAAFTTEELAALTEDERALTARVTLGCVSLLADLVKESSQHRILREAEFFKLGIDLFAQQSSICPFCARDLNTDTVDHIKSRHAELINQKRSAAGLETAQQALKDVLDDIGQQVSDYYKRTASRTKALLDNTAAMPQLAALLASRHEAALVAITSAIRDIGEAVATFVEAGKEVRTVLSSLSVSLTQPVSNLAQAESLAHALAGYFAGGRAVQEAVGRHAAELDRAKMALTEELHSVAGTKSISLLIELLESTRKLEKRMRIAAVAEELKDLKVSVDTFVTKIMLDVISGELASDVMTWYKRIRTIGDPDVHFAGFDMKKTPQGGRVQIKASSYGKDLVSAVSSLSESKLNALGLCISIAINLKEVSCFEFLIIDDPIQSWDRDHEMQFIEVIRELVDRGKQVVLLSHNSEWIKQVRVSCADLQGLYYEITGYTDDGPVIKEVSWVEPHQRLQTILAILQDQSADSVRLQQAEQELRQVFCQYTCILYEGLKGNAKNPAKLNAVKIKGLLTECAIEDVLVNAIMAIFETVDDAHHASPDYSPNRQKLHQYYGTAVRLSKAVQAKLQKGKMLTVVTEGWTA